MQGVAYQPGVLLAFIHVTQKNKNKKLINLKSVVYLNRDKKKNTAPELQRMFGWEVLWRNHLGNQVCNMRKSYLEVRLQCVWRSSNPNSPFIP